MISIYIAVNRLIDLVLSPFSGLAPLWPLSAGAAAMGVAAMVIYKYASNQTGIRQAKDQIKGHFYEVWLYLDEAAVLARSQLRIFYHALRYLGFALPPLVIMVVLFFPLFANFEMRYGRRPVRPGETVLVKLRLQGPFDGWQSRELLAVPETVARIGWPVRFIRKTLKAEDSVIEKSREYEADYKLTPLSPGRHELKFTLPGGVFSVPLIAESRGYGKRLNPLSAARLGSALLYPPLSPLPPESGISQVEITYPSSDFPCLGWNRWWVWPFLIISMIAALAVKGLFKVEI